ncbi:MAG: AAA family ATPase [Aeriscardovia sp.]|nr:AAA family ATPase [Aeriscardovia sp.]
MTKQKKEYQEIMPTSLEAKQTVPTKEMVERNRRLDELNQLRITTKTVLSAEKPAISADGVYFFELGDVGAVKAKQKAGKTTMLKVLTAAWMKGELFRLKSELDKAKVLWLDTEQKTFDVKKIIDDVKLLSGVDDAYIDSHLKLYSLRSLTFKTLLSDTELLISSYRPHVVIIDGLVDLISSFNDEAESHLLINKLIALCDNYKCAIIAVLHENKNSDDHNMRGHLGTMLAQKAATVLQCQKDGNNVIAVSCSDSRHAAMPTWKIKYDENGHITAADGPQKTTAQVEAERRKNIVKSILKKEGGMITRKKLTEKLEKELRLSRTRVSNLISDFLKDFLCEVDGQIQVQPELDWPA